MAKYSSNALLGYEDELVTDKHKHLLNFTVNKLGGKPDFPSNIELDPPKCPLCQLPRPLVVQIYAPLENSTYHRTLYVFACINPNCWNSSESWICLRIQTDEKITETMEETNASVVKTTVTDWCVDADDWDDSNANINEENGNVVEKLSDEDDESCSFEESFRSSLNLTVDDKNANVGAAQGGAVGRLHSPLATAEIEGNEGEVITIDPPTLPQNDIGALLHEVTPLPPEICHDHRRNVILHFVSAFISVGDETSGYVSNSTISDSHVKELLAEYQQKNETLSPEGGGGGGESARNVDLAHEKYEKSNPAHGDKMFHHFLSKIQANPGQILRYDREKEPLLLYPIQDVATKCQYCQNDMVFELQLLPTVISKLRLTSDQAQHARLEFGTILIYTCRKSCWSTDADYRIENVILQREVY